MVNVLWLLYSFPSGGFWLDFLLGFVHLTSGFFARFTFYTLPGYKYIDMKNTKRKSYTLPTLPSEASSGFSLCLSVSLLFDFSVSTALLDFSDFCVDSLASVSLLLAFSGVALR